MTDAPEIETTLRQIISKVTGRQTFSFTGSTDLIESGILDSLDWSVFLLDVESAFSIKIPDEQVEDRHLQIVGNLVSFISGSE